VAVAPFADVELFGRFLARGRRGLLAWMSL
jgi:hypothetical protein